MNRHQVNTLLEILAGLHIGDNTVEQPLDTAMKEFYSALIANSGGKPLGNVKQEFEKKVDLLRWKLCQAFQHSHKKQLALVKEKIEARPLKKEAEFTIKAAAAKLGMTPQNLNKHLENHPEVKVRTESPRKRYISESELTKLKNILGITG